MDPAEAVVKPGCKQQVSVVFRAEANRAWAATLGLDISERDPRDQHNGIPYELGGDSCIPGENVVGIRGSRRALTVSTKPVPCWQN